MMVNGCPLSELIAIGLMMSADLNLGGTSLPMLNVTSEHRDRICHASSHATNVAHEPPKMPSCTALTRYLNAFFDSCYPHLPVVHVTSFKLDAWAPKTLLAMASLGAHSRLERRQATALFHFAKALLYQSEENMSDQETSQQQELMQQAQCALLLITFATWQSEPGLWRDAVNMHSLLTRCVRELQPSMVQDMSQHGLDWKSWLQYETTARISYFSFTLLNMHSIAFGIPPILLSDELNLALPSSPSEWNAPTATDWTATRATLMTRRSSFQNAFLRLRNSWIGAESPHSQAVNSALGNHVLLHALMQRITLIQQVAGSELDQNQTIFNDQKEVIRCV